MADLFDLGLDYPDLDPVDYEMALPMGEKEWLDDLLDKLTVSERTSASPTVTKLNMGSCPVVEAVTRPSQSAKSSLKCTACPAIFTSVNGLRRHWVSTHR